MHRNGECQLHGDAAEDAEGTDEQSGHPASGPICPHFSYLGQAPTFALGKFMCCLQVLDNPVTQSLMSNPDVIRQMLESNPQMQEVEIYVYFLKNIMKHMQEVFHFF